MSFIKTILSLFATQPQTVRVKVGSKWQTFTVEEVSDWNLTPMVQAQEIISDGDYVDKQIRDTTLKNKTFKNCKFTDCNLGFGMTYQNCNFIKCTFTGKYGSLGGAYDAKEAIYRNCRFEDCLIQRRGKLERARFFNCFFSGTWDKLMIVCPRPESGDPGNFFSNCDLSGIKLKDVCIVGPCFDKDCKLPALNNLLLDNKDDKLMKYFQQQPYTDKDYESRAKLMFAPDYIENVPVVIMDYPHLQGMFNENGQYERIMQELKPFILSDKAKESLKARN